METIESINKSRKASLKHSIKALQSAFESLKKIQKENATIKGSYMQNARNNINRATEHFHAFNAYDNVLKTE